MAPLLLAAIPTLMKSLPSLAGLFMGNKGEDAVKDVLSLGKTVLGVSSDEDVLAKISSDPEQARLFQTAVLKDKTRLEELYLLDKQSARDMYVSSDHKQADKIAERISLVNGDYVIFLILVQILVMVLCPALGITLSPATYAILGNVCGAGVSLFVTEKITVANFYFGSSIGSKSKDIQK